MQEKDLFDFENIDKKIFLRFEKETQTIEWNTFPKNFFINAKYSENLTKMQKKIWVEVFDENKNLVYKCLSTKCEKYGEYSFITWFHRIKILDNDFEKPIWKSLEIKNKKWNGQIYNSEAANQRFSSINKIKFVQKRF